MNEISKIVDRLLLFYGLYLPHHPGKWRVAAALEGLVKPCWTAPRLVERQGFRWQLDLSQLVPRRLYYLGEHERWETRLLRRVVKPGWIVADVGANLGYYSLLFSRWVGPGGKVYAFEPTRDLFASLSHHVRLNDAGNVSAHRLALGDKPGRVRLILNPSNPGGSRLAKDGEEGEAAECETLDAFVEREHIEHLDLVKVDIEGSELLFLRGAERTIRATRPLMLIEYSPDCMRRYSFSGAELLQAMEDLGYRLYRVSRARLEPFTDTGEETNLMCVPVEAGGVGVAHMTQRSFGRQRE